MTPGEKEAALYAVRFVFRRLGYVAAALSVVALAYLLRGVLVPLFLAFILAYALDPLVGRVERLGFRRSSAALVVMLGLLGVSVALLMVAVPHLLDEFAAAAEALPQQLRALRERFDPWLWDRFHVRLPHSWGDVTRDYGDELRNRAPMVAERALAAIFGTFSLVMVLGGFLIVPVFAIYLLVDFGAIVERAGVLIPRRYAGTIYELARQIHLTLGRYVRGQITACLVLSIVYALGLRVLGLRLAIPIGIITGLLAFVPYVGFGLGLLLAVGMAILDWHGPGMLLGVVVVMLVGQLIDGLLVTPRIVGGSVGLKPIEVLLTMMTTATLFGFVGVLLAVPLGAVVKILVVRAARAYLQSIYYRQIPPSSTPTPLPGARLVDEGYLPTPMPMTRPGARSHSVEKP